MTCSSFAGCSMNVNTAAHSTSRRENRVLSMMPTLPPGLSTRRICRNTLSGLEYPSPQQHVTRSQAASGTVFKYASNVGVDECASIRIGISRSGEHAL